MRIDNDNKAAAIIAQYQQLIEDVDEVPTPEPEEDPCNDLAGNPTVDIDPNQGKAGRTIRVTAKRVAGPEVVVFWRNHNDRAGKGDVRGDCTANVRIKVPNDARPGRYDVIVQDARDKEASERFQVID